jgi:hypothetical protein
VEFDAEVDHEYSYTLGMKYYSKVGNYEHKKLIFLHFNRKRNSFIVINNKF